MKLNYLFPNVTHEHTPADPEDFGLLTLRGFREEFRLGLGDITGPLLVALEELGDNRGGGGHLVS